MTDYEDGFRAGIEAAATLAKFEASSLRCDSCGGPPDKDDVDDFVDAIRALASAASGTRAFSKGDRVTKIKGSSWTGSVVGTYSTALTPEGYCVESENEPGSVQIYPRSALAPRPPAEPGRDEAVIFALRALVDATGRHLELGPFKSVKKELAAAYELGVAALDRDIGHIGPGHTCKHGVRWPHSCTECDERALAVRAVVKAARLPGTEDA